MDLTDSTRPVMLIWPRKGKPLIVTNKTAAGLVKRDGWIDDIVLYEAYVESPQQKLVDMLNEMGLARRRSASRRDYYQRAALGSDAKALPKLDMVDCTALMDRVRWIKTDEEVALIRRAADLLDDAYLETFRRIRPGDTERKLHADLMGTCLRLGFEWAHGILNAFRNTVPYGGESDFRDREGRRHPHRLRRLPAQLSRATSRAR